ncbi:MAG: hypothetical protein J5643_05160 [Lachnospiraceae bacterium]|nr:hypothetical protein [Lachnospiraceae bacterium]
MAEQKKATASESGRKKRVSESGQTVVQAKSQGSATGKRIGAVCLWILAIAFEVLAILVLTKHIEITFMSPLVAVIILLVLDFACVVGGSMLWKKANRIDPASEKNKVKFWLWNNMGLIVTVFAFVPFIILTLMSKEADKKTKGIAVGAAAVLLIIAGLCSIDWNPISAEEKAAQEGLYTDAALPEGKVYFTQFGKKYHLYEDCSHINKSDKIYEVVAGAEENEGKACVDVAIEYGCDDVCKTCAGKFEKAQGEKAADGN